MEIQFSPEAKKILNVAIASGLYRSADEYINDIILNFERLKLQRLRQEIQDGLDELNRGEGIELNMAKINREIDQEFDKSLLATMKADTSFSTAPLLKESK